MPEKFESPESGKEEINNKEKAAEMAEEALRSLEEAKRLMSPELQKEIRKREILEGVGVESIAEVEDILGGVEESLKNAEEGSEEYNQLVEQKNYFDQVLKDLKE